MLQKNQKTYLIIINYEYYYFIANSRLYTQKDRNVFAIFYDLFNKN